MQTKVLAGGGVFTSPNLSEPPAPAQRRAARVVIALCAFLLSLLMITPSAFAGSVESNTAYNDNAFDIQDQTIVGEGQNNNVTITNKTTDSPSPTGVFMANLPVFVIGAFVVAGAVVIVARAKRKAGEIDE